MRFGIHVDELSIAAAKKIEEVLNKLTVPEEIIAKRGTGTRHIFKNMPPGWKENPSLLVGKTFTDEGFTAASPFKDGGFSGCGTDRAELYIRIPEGTHAAYIEKVAHNDLEKELLLQRGYTYRIIKAEYRANPMFPEDKDLKVWVEVVLK